MDVTTDPLRSAVRSSSGPDRDRRPGRDDRLGELRAPRTVGTIQVDCPVVSAYLKKTTEDHWGLEKTARLRFWPAGSPWIEPDTFVYPVRQRWFAGLTQMGNEPTYVDAGEDPRQQEIYYHAGSTSAAPRGSSRSSRRPTDWSSRGERSAAGARPQGTPVRPRYDVVYLRDDRGWYYRYSHMQTIDPAIKPGATVKKGQRLGVLGKEGGSRRLVASAFRDQEPAALGQVGHAGGLCVPLADRPPRVRSPDVIAVARPHILPGGRPVVLDGGKSWCRDGRPARFRLDVHRRHDRDRAAGRAFVRSAGNVQRDPRGDRLAGARRLRFRLGADPRPGKPDGPSADDPRRVRPDHGMHAGRSGDVQGADIRDDRRTRDLGLRRRQPAVTVHSDGNVDQHAPDGYAVAVHRFAKPGDYLVRVERADRRGWKATARLHVHVD